VKKATRADPRPEDLLRERNRSNEFRLSNLFPEFNGMRCPLVKQEQVFLITRTGMAQGGGIVYCGGKGSGKTITGRSWIIWLHHLPKYKGLRTLIGRETYPSLLTSTGQEFFEAVESLPAGLVKGYSKPTKNAMGWVEWSVGGVTLLCSLSDSNTWESANLGAVWVDEAHRQNMKVVKDLETRIRQIEGPRVALYTTNPAGKNELWKKANKQSKTKAPNWHWIQAPTDENPALPDDYIRRLIATYGYNTPAYKRWVKGESSALEGSVFTEFDPMPEHKIHIVPAFDLPEELLRGRGLDYGVANPTAVVWGAQTNAGEWFFYDLHYKAQMSVEEHALEIIQRDGDKKIQRVPADPSIFAKNRTDKMTGIPYSVADEFFANGIRLYPGNNERNAGLQKMLELIRMDEERCHYHTFEMGAPRFFIFDLPQMEPMIQEISNLLWAKETAKGQPEETEKKNDHCYDATRYLIMDRPIIRDVEPIRAKPRLRETSRGRSWAGY
jgi:PBSX family phage terminase large subunit